MIHADNGGQPSGERCRPWVRPHCWSVLRMLAGEVRRNTFHPLTSPDHPSKVLFIFLALTFLIQTSTHCVAQRGQQPSENLPNANDSRQNPTSEAHLRNKHCLKNTQKLLHFSCSSLMSTQLSGGVCPLGLTEPARPLRFCC